MKLVQNPIAGRQDPLVQQYYAEAAEVPLLNAEDEKNLSIRMLEGDKAYATLIDRSHPYLTEKIKEPMIQECIRQIREMLPQNFFSSIQQIEGLQLSDMVRYSHQTDVGLLHAVLEIAKQKSVIQEFLCASHLQKEHENGVYEEELFSLIARIISFVEKKVIPLAKQLVGPGVHDTFATKEKIIAHAEAAREQMRRANLKLVINFAKKYQGRGLEISDLIAEGNFGLMKAVENFDHTIGTKFSTYAAWWIKQRVSRALDNQGQGIRVPTHIAQAARNFRGRLAQLTTGENHLVSEEEGFSQLGYSEKEERGIKSALRAKKVLSTSASYEGGAEGNSMTSLEDLLSDEQVLSPEDRLVKTEEAEMQSDVFQFFSNLLNSMVSTEELSEREAEIMRMRVGDRFEGHKTLDETGIFFGVSRERIRQIEFVVECKLKTQIAIMKSKRHAVRDGNGKKCPELSWVLEIFSEKKIGKGMARQLTVTQKEGIRQLMGITCNDQAKHILTLTLGLDGNSPQTAASVADQLGTLPAHVNMVRDAAIQWMHAAVEHPAGIAYIGEELGKYHTEQGVHSFIPLFQEIREMLTTDGETDVADTQTSFTHEIGKCTYVNGTSDIVDIESLHTAEEELAADDHSAPKRIVSLLKTNNTSGVVQDPERVVIERIKKMLREEGMNHEKQEEPTPIGSLPDWIRKLEEPTAHRLHTLLMHHPSPEGIKDFFSKAFEKPLSQGQLQKILFDCLINVEQTRLCLQNHIRQPDMPHLVRGESNNKCTTFLRAVEQDRIVVPNLQKIIERHFEENPKPIADRVLVDTGARDGRLAEKLGSMFGTIIAIEDHPSLLRALNEKANTKLLPVKGSIKALAVTPELYNIKADIILFNRTLIFLQGEQYERALMWAQSALMENGITIAVCNDDVAETGSRAHMRQKLGMREFQPPPSRYRNFLTNRGYNVQVGHATLGIHSKTEKGLETTKEIAALFLPQKKRAELDGKLENYMQHYVRGKGEDGTNVLNHNWYFLTAHQNAQANSRMPTNSVYSSAIAREEYATKVPTLSPQKRAETAPVKNEINLPTVDNEGEEKKGFWAGLQLLGDECESNLRSVKQTSDTCAQSPTTLRKKKVLSYAREDVKSGREFQHVRGQMMRLLNGRLVTNAHKDYSDPIFPKTKRRWAKESRVYNPKVAKRLSKKVRDFNEKLLKFQGENAYTISPKMGEISIDGKICVQLKPFAFTYGLDKEALKEAVNALNLEPAGWALRMDSEVHALAMGYKTPVFELAQLLQLPFVQAKIEAENEFALGALDAETESGNERSVFLRELDAEISADEIAQLQDDSDETSGAE